MKKISIFTIVLILILTTTLFFLLTNSNNSLSYYMHTKAICNDTNFCQDYMISCDKNKLLMTTPITGAAIQLPLDWQDPRNEVDQKLCN
ncbi:hypothetical protein KAI04_00400 [Candidatus Pacearchaeota archaeon]|nr:hypothetical protein [Candidatus Pacearchaeota archaeon]